MQAFSTLPVLQVVSSRDDVDDSEADKEEVAVRLVLLGLHLQVAAVSGCR